MLSDVYNSKILEYAGNIERIGRLQAPDATARAHSKLCGSTVTVDLCMRDGKVVDFAHEVKACALGQAASAIMAKTVIGATGAQLRALRETMIAMLKEGGPPPDGKFSEFRFLEPVREYKARHASTLLTFDAVVDCVEQIERKGEISGSEEGHRAQKRQVVEKAARDALSSAGIRYRVR